MKRWIALLTVICMAAGLAACGAETPPVQPAQSGAQSTAQPESAAPAPEDAAADLWRRLEGRWITQRGAFLEFIKDGETLLCREGDEERGIVYEGSPSACTADGENSWQLTVDFYDLSAENSTPAAKTFSVCVGKQNGDTVLKAVDFVLAQGPADYLRSLADAGFSAGTLWAELDGVWVTEDGAFIWFLEEDGKPSYITGLLFSGYMLNGYAQALEQTGDNTFAGSVHIFGDGDGYDKEIEIFTENAAAGSIRTTDIAVTGEVRTFRYSSDRLETADYVSAPFLSADYTKEDLWADLAGVWENDAGVYVQFGREGNGLGCSFGFYGSDFRMDSVLDSIETTGNAAYCGTLDFFANRQPDGGGWDAYTGEFELITANLANGEIQMTDLVSTDQLSVFYYTGPSVDTGVTDGQPMDHAAAWERFGGIWAREDEEGNLKFILFSQADGGFSAGTLFSGDVTGGSVESFTDYPASAAGCGNIEMTVFSPAYENETGAQPELRFVVRLEYYDGDPVLLASLGDGAACEYVYIAPDFESLPDVTEVLETVR